jgi:hypothetical protein
MLKPAKPYSRIVKPLSEIRSRYVKVLETGAGKNSGGTMCSTDPECGMSIGLVLSRRRNVTSSGALTARRRELFAIRMRFDIRW